MQENARHLVRLWVPVIAICVLVATGLLFNMSQGETIAYAAIIGMACVLGAVVWTRYRVRKAFAHPTPDRAIALFTRLASRMPYGKPLAAYQCAHAAVLYGDFDRARQELCVVNWSSLPPMYQGFESHIHSLFALFESRDFNRGLEFAQEALDLCAVSEIFPGARTTRRALSAQVAICRLLLGDTNAAILQELESAVARLPGIGPAVHAWALAIYYHRAGDEARATKYLGIARKLLPHSPVVADYARPVSLR